MYIVFTVSLFVIVFNGNGGYEGGVEERFINVTTIGIFEFRCFSK